MEKLALTSIADIRLLIELEFPSKESNGLKIGDFFLRKRLKKTFHSIDYYSRIY
jgi:hypothetical protein